VVKRKERIARISEKRKRDIVKAALAIFARQGYASSTVDDIAREAGVAVGTLYKYYESKRHILVEVINAVVFRENFLDQFASNTVEDDSSHWPGVIEGPVQAWLDDPGVQIFLLCEILRDTELRQHYSSEIYKPAFQIFENYIKCKQDTGYFRQTDPAVVTRIIWGLTLGFMIIREIEGPEGPCYSLPVARIARELTDQGLIGILSRGD